MERSGRFGVQDASEVISLALTLGNKVVEILPLLFSMTDRNKDCGEWLRIPCNGGHYQVVSWILSNCSKVTFGVNQIGLAAQNGHHKIVELLLNHPSMNDSPLIRLQSQLDYSTILGHRDVLNVYLANERLKNYITENMDCSIFEEQLQFAEKEKEKLKKLKEKLMIINQKIERRKLLGLF